MPRRAAILTLIAILSCGVVYAQKPVIMHPVADTSPPTFVSAAISSNGTTLSVAFDEAVSAADSAGFTLTPSGSAATLTLSSGSGTDTLLFTISRTIYSTETATIAYSSTTGDVQDISPAGNDLATFSAVSVENGSLEEEPPGGIAPVLASSAPLLIADEGSISWSPTVLQGTSITYSATSLPTGASINSSTGAITGTLSTPGKWTTEVTATNAYGTDVQRVPVSVYSSTANISQSSGFPYYCNTANRKYTLTENITADGTAIAIIAQNVSLDLNGFTITYDNATPITVSNGSFETGSGGAATGWDFTNAPNGARFDGDFLDNEVYDGSYSLQFNDTTATEYVESTGTITLEANTTYTVSAMFRYGETGNNTNPGVKGYVQLFGSGLTTREVSKTTTNSRGIQLVEFEFTTGGTAEVYYVRAGIVGHASGSAPYYIDDIKVQRTKVYGVAATVQGWTMGNWPGLSSNGDATNATVINGTITQGSEGATWAHGIHYRSTGMSFDDLAITVNGANSSCIYTTDSNSAITFIHGNTLTSNVETVTSRDAFNGAVIFYSHGHIIDNEITNGPHVGIKAGGSTVAGTQTTVRGNTIALKARYTNAFAIIGGVSSQIFNNTINSGTGEYTSRGIAPGSGTAGSLTKAYNNTIYVQQLADNQEYGGTPIGGVYGIQVEGSGNIEVYGNTVTAYGTTLAYAFRATSSSTNVHVHDNTFTATANGSGGHAAALSFSEASGAGFLFEDNTLVTNEGLIGLATSATGWELYRTTITVDTPITNPYIFDVDYAPGSSVHVIAHFIDTTFTDAGSRTYFDAATTRAAAQYGGATTTRMQVYLDWTTTIAVEDAGTSPIASAGVSIEDVNNTVAFTGTSDAGGLAEAELCEQLIQGAVNTNYNDYTATATSGMDSGDTTFTADSTQTITVTVP